MQRHWRTLWAMVMCGDAWQGGKFGVELGVDECFERKLRVNMTSRVCVGGV